MVIKIKVLLSFLLMLIATGCATKERDYKWGGGSGSVQKFKFDRLECVERASGFQDNFSLFYNECMSSKGYYKIYIDPQDQK